MEIAYVVQAHPDSELIKSVPWNYFAKELAQHDVFVSRFNSIDEAWRPFDAMILLVWLDWRHRGYFKVEQILPVMEKYSIYRATFPATIQIVVNHVDMARRATAIPYWRLGDPILFKTPAYDRTELAPFPAQDIFPYEVVCGSACFRDLPCQYAAGFIGTPSGPRGYRERVARETAKVGLGRCLTRKLRKSKYEDLMGRCRIIVCPQGWGEQSYRHWDAWKSGKPVLTDAACDSVEMIPGIRLQRGVHYLVYDDPAEIPDIVSDWTRRGRRDDLDQVARNGQQAALSYDGCAWMLKFFERLKCLPSRGAR
jgi:hypothetical protein